MIIATCTYHYRQSSRAARWAERFLSTSEETQAVAYIGRCSSVGRDEHLAGGRCETGRYSDQALHAAQHIHTHHR